MKSAIQFFLFNLVLTSYALACPYCVGTDQGGRDSNTTLILVCFILAIYIPYFIIYRLIKKGRALKEAHDSSGSSRT